MKPYDVESMVNKTLVELVYIITRYTI